MGVERSSSSDQVPAAGGVIEVRIRELGQLFNSMDPSPFHEKELDPDAEDYIVGSAKELPTQSPASLLVHLDQPAELPDEERIVQEAIRAHFARQSERLRRDLRDLLRRGWKSLAIGLVFLAACVAGGESIMRHMGERPLATALRESLLVGGWVAMWRPMEIFLYDWWPILSERRLHDRLSRISVRIVHRIMSAAHSS